MTLTDWIRKGNDYLLTFESRPGWFARLFGEGPRTVRFLGSCTVWWHYPDLTRCGTLTECWLADVWKRIVTGGGRAG